MPFVGGEGEGRQPGLRRPAIPDIGRTAQPCGAGKGGRTGAVPPLLREVDGSIALKASERIEKQATKIRCSERFRMSTEIGRAQIVQSDPALAK